MMRSVRLFIILLFLICPAFILSSHASPRIYYIHVGNKKLEIGTYDTCSLKTIPFRAFPWDRVNDSLITDFILGGESCSMLYYIHCWLGDTGFYQKGSIRAIRDLPVDKIIIVRWGNSGLSYLNNYRKAEMKGSKISGLLEKLLGHPMQKNILLIHSMGHSFWLGAHKDLKPDKKYLELIIMAGADLNDDIFENRLSLLPQQAGEIVIYKHQKDRILRLARSMHNHKRLGLDGLKSASSYLNIQTVDVTSWPGKKGINPANHTYFRDHDGIKKDMEIRISALSHNNR